LKKYFNPLKSIEMLFLQLHQKIVLFYDNICPSLSPPGN